MTRDELIEAINEEIDVIWAQERPDIDEIMKAIDKYTGEESKAAYDAGYQHGGIDS